MKNTTNSKLFVVIRLVIIFIFLCLPGCGEEESQDPGVVCECEQNQCPPNRCNVKVRLTESCRGKMDSARVMVDGQYEDGVVTPDEPYYTCGSWEQGQSREVLVRSEGFQSQTLVAQCILGGSSISFTVECHLE